MHDGRRYLAGVDGLRALAIAAVFVYHLNPSWLPGGFTGVDVFFVISGYLIIGIVLRELDAGHFSFRRFYQRRIARLLAPFALMATSTTVAAWLIYSDQDFASTGANLVASAASVANVKALFQGNYFELSADAQPLLHTWSLAVEEQFYLTFPLLLVIAHRFWRTRLRGLIAFSGVLSFVTCLVISLWKPSFAFYLLPTRAWELLAGGLVANLPTFSKDGALRLSVVGSALVALSAVTISDTQNFPGWLAAIPVLGAAAVIAGCQREGPVTRLLSLAPLTALGRLSYSLYLWHWPTFAFVDYALPLQSSVTRTCLKVAISVGAAIASYHLVEGPARRVLNESKRALLAYGCLAMSLVAFVPLGNYVRRTHYVNAELSNVRTGGLLFSRSHEAPLAVLLGDSNGSMYGIAIRDLAKNLDLRLRVLSVAAGDALPSANGRQSDLWRDSIAVLQREKPALLIYVSLWTKAADHPEVVARAVDELKNLASEVILITQPPELPASATRQALRDGSRAPFIEADATRLRRRSVNRYLLGLHHPNVTVLDIEDEFTLPDGSVRIMSDEGAMLYHDKTHLSGIGARRVGVRVEAVARRFLQSGALAESKMPAHVP